MVVTIFTVKSIKQYSFIQILQAAENYIFMKGGFFMQGKLNSLDNLLSMLDSREFDNNLTWLYHGDTPAQVTRYKEAVDEYKKAFGDSQNAGLFSSPGRSEIGGNHTDHQNGKVLAAAVTMDLLACAAPNDKNEISILSDGYPLCTVNLDDIKVDENLYNTSDSLIAGVVDGFIKNGHKVGGFNAYMSSQVPKGSGLSSSASYEVMVGTVLNYLYNDNSVSPIEVAQISQYAENVFFGKPSGLMDQMACSVGGFVAIDFKDNKKPIVEQVDCDLKSLGYTICIVNAGGSHADLTPDYSAVPVEMKGVAAQLGEDVLREVNFGKFLMDMPNLRTKVSDRALLRAIHFFAENRRAGEQAEALKKSDIHTFLQLIKESASSSQEQLQNIYPLNTEERSVSLALALTNLLLCGTGACRVHGGGFAGTIQAFVPNTMVDEYCAEMEAVFGADCCYKLAVRPVGGYMLQKS